MFESAELGHRVDRKTFKAQEPLLRASLLEAQFTLLDQARRAVVVLVNGVPGAGKGETVNLLNEWMDPRHIRTEAFAEAPADGRPPMWRYWQALAPKGHIGILFGSWYTEPIVRRVAGLDKKARFEQRLQDIRALERMLTAEGVVLVKLWFHMSEQGVRQRMAALRKDPRTAWRAGDAEMQRLDRFGDFLSVCGHALRKTHTAEAPWLIIEGSDPAYRSLTAGRHLLEQLQQANAASARRVQTPSAGAMPAPIDGRSVLDTFDYTRRVGEASYKKRLEALQGRLNGLLRDPAMRSRSLVLVFEGMDAAGKGSAIRRITQAMDARFYRVVPVAAPNEAERAQPYLWRFWRHLPACQHTTVFDRSWYGRVLVERIEGFCAEADWARAYDEINAFEEQMHAAGSVVVKFWLAITPGEQLQRFEQRQNTPHKRHKITPEDWRNRDKWPLYAQAVDDMLERTGTETAPWHVVASDDKRWSRLTVLQTLCERLEQVFEVDRKAPGHRPDRKKQ